MCERDDKFHAEPSRSRLTNILVCNSGIIYLIDKTGAHFVLLKVKLFERASENLNVRAFLPLSSGGVKKKREGGRDSY